MKKSDTGATPLTGMDMGYGMKGRSGTSQPRLAIVNPEKQTLTFVAFVPCRAVRHSACVIVRASQAMALATRVCKKLH